jgi:hypothetical protein
VFRAKIEINQALSAGNGIIRASGVALSGPIEFAIQRVVTLDPVLGPQGWQATDYWFAALAREERSACLIEVGPGIVNYLSFSNYRMWIRHSGSEERAEGILSGGALFTTGGTNASAEPPQRPPEAIPEPVRVTSESAPPVARPDFVRRGAAGGDVIFPQAQLPVVQPSSDVGKKWLLIASLALLALAAIIWLLSPYGREWFTTGKMADGTSTGATTPAPKLADGGPLAPLPSHRTQTEPVKEVSPPSAVTAPSVLQPEVAPAAPASLPAVPPPQPDRRHPGSTADQPQLSGLQDIRNFLAGNPSANDAYQQGVKTWAGGSSGEAFILFKYAADSGNAQAATAIGRMYDPLQDGKVASNFPRDAGLAAEWYGKANTSGDAGSEKYIEALREWLTQKSKSGDASARDTLSRMP